jgi:hypothetical protein
MRRFCKVSSVCAIFLLAVSMSAFAGSTNESFNNAALTGISGGGDVSGTFSFDSVTHQLSNIAISFASSAFGNVNANDGSKSINGVYNSSTGNWSFQWQAIKGLDLITYDVLFNPTTGQFTASGAIANFWEQGKFNYNDMQIPEGGTQLSYLALSGLAMFAGILIAKKHRPVARTTHSS